MSISRCEAEERVRGAQTEQEALSAIYNWHQLAFRAVTEGYRKAVGLADPRVGVQNMSFLLAHNWGNDRARYLADEKLQVAWSRLRARYESWYTAVQHDWHVRNGEAGRYRWCDLCQRKAA